MKRGKTVLTILALCGASLAIPRAAAADAWNMQTTLTFSEAVEIPGRVLPAGTYVFQLADSPSSRHIVQVFDREGRMLARVLTIPTARTAAADDTRIMFAEPRTGARSAIKKWFYPGERQGEEFIYSSHAN